MTVDPAEGLHRAWCEWDDQPSARWAANAMVGACSVYAHHIGTTSSQLRQMLTHLRRLGHTRSEAIAIVANPTHPACIATARKDAAA